MPGPVFCLLLGVSSYYAQPITGQVTEVTCHVIGRAQLQLIPSKGQKTDPVFKAPSVLKFHIICEGRQTWPSSWDGGIDHSGHLAMMLRLHNWWWTGWQFNLCWNKLNFNLHKTHQETTCFTAMSVTTAVQALTIGTNNNGHYLSWSTLEPPISSTGRIESI